MNPDAGRALVGGLPTIVVEGAGPSRLVVVILHGWAMMASDLEPFARSMGLPATFYFPEGPVTASPGGRGWWSVDEERRAATIALGPRDLAEEAPPGTATARRHLSRIVAEVTARHPGLPLAVAGFSQGGMLACDATVRGSVTVAGLALLSSSRITAEEWLAHAANLRGLPVFVSHGTADHDLAFAAGERLRDFARAAGAEVTWTPFEGGHEIPLPVWRALKRFLAALSASAAPGGP